MFLPPIDSENLVQKYGWETEKWYPEMLKLRRVSGDTFQNLTLAPSINFDPVEWHGSIVNGELISA